MSPGFHPFSLNRTCAYRIPAGCVILPSSSPALIFFSSTISLRSPSFNFCPVFYLFFFILSIYFSCCHPSCAFFHGLLFCLRLFPLSFFSSVPLFLFPFNFFLLSIFPFIFSCFPFSSFKFLHGLLFCLRFFLL